MSEEKKNEVLDQEKELDMDELDAVAGGVCACPVVGGGTAEAGKKACGCVLGGAGDCSEDSFRCACFVGGGGE